MDYISIKFSHTYRESYNITYDVRNGQTFAYESAFYAIITILPNNILEIRNKKHPEVLDLQRFTKLSDTFE